MSENSFSSNRDSKLFNNSDEVLNTSNLRQPILKKNNRFRQKSHDILESDTSQESQEKGTTQTIHLQSISSNDSNSSQKIIIQKQLSQSQSNGLQTSNTLLKSGGEIIVGESPMQVSKKKKGRESQHSVIKVVHSEQNPELQLKSSDSSSQSPKSKSENESENYDSFTVKMQDFSKTNILKQWSSKKLTNDNQITEIKIPKNAFSFSPESIDKRNSQLGSSRMSPLKQSSPIGKSGRTGSRFSIQLITKIKLAIRRLFKLTCSFKSKGIGEDQLKLIGDLSILKANDVKTLKEQQKLSYRILNDYMNFATFNPYSIYKMIWDMIVLFIMSFLFISIPLLISFGVNFSDLFGEFPYYTLSITLLMDAFINANTGYYKNGALVISKYMVLRNYAKKILLIDLFGTTPVLFYTIFPNSTSRIFLFLYIVKYKSITKIFKRIELRLDLKASLLNKIALLKLFFTILFIAHLFANAWVILPKLNSKQNWFIKAQIDQEEWYIKYMTAYYYITVTMVTVGYGDITPNNHLETFFSIITILLTCAVFAYSVNSIGFILEEINREQKNLNKNMQIINSYMEAKKISRELRYQIREYLEHFWRENNAGNVEQEQLIIKHLAHNLKQKLFVEANSLILKNNKIFANKFSERVLMKTLNIVKEYKYTPQQVIFSRYQTDDSGIYFIENGNVEVFLENEKNQKTIHIKSKKQRREKYTNLSFVYIGLEKGAYFGEIGFYTGQERCMSVRSKDFATLLKIERDDFLNIIKMFPKDEELFHLIKDQILYSQKFGQIGTKCYGCQRGDHVVAFCPLVQFVPNKIYIYGRHNYSPIQIRQEYKREQIGKCNTRKNINLIQQGALDIFENYSDLMPQTQSSQSDYFSVESQIESSYQMEESENEQDAPFSANNNNNMKFQKSSFFVRAQQGSKNVDDNQDFVINEINEESGGESDNQELNDRKKIRTKNSSEISQKSKNSILNSSERGSFKSPANLMPLKVNTKLKRSFQQDFENFKLEDSKNNQNESKKPLLNGEESNQNQEDNLNISSQESVYHSSNNENEDHNLHQNLKKQLSSNSQLLHKNSFCSPGINLKSIYSNRGSECPQHAIFDDTPQFNTPLRSIERNGLDFSYNRPILQGNGMSTHSKYHNSFCINCGINGNNRVSTRRQSKAGILQEGIFNGSGASRQSMLMTGTKNSRKNDLNNPLSMVQMMNKQSLPLIDQNYKESMKFNSHYPKGSSDLSNLLVGEQVIKKINAVYDKLIDKPQNNQDFALEFDKQNDYSIYFPTGNLSSITFKRKPVFRRTHAPKLTHFLMNMQRIGNMNPEDSKLKRGFSASQQMKQSISKQDSSIIISPDSSPTKIQKQQGGLLIKGLQSAFCQDGVQRSSGSIEMSVSISPKKRNS